VVRRLHLVGVVHCSIMYLPLRQVRHG
jgi:hypothetical protein